MFVNCIFYGTDFSPRKAEEIISFEFDDKIEKGDFGKLGKYKGEKTPYGSAHINIEGSNIIYNMDKLLDKIYQNHAPLIAFGLEEIYLTLNFPKNHDVNIEIKKETLRKICDLGIAFSISNF